MKRLFLLTICIAAIVVWQSCKKNNNINPSSIVGKWYENKLTLTQKNITNSAVATKTYESNNFTAGDFFRFSAADTASVWTDGSYFTMNGKFFVTNPIEQELFYRSYRVQGSLLILQVGFFPTCYNCSQPGPDTVKILRLDKHNLVLQQQLPDTSSVYKGMSTTYYVR
ncbi:MAG: hypothetical protein ACHQF4_09455 [Sphingobacteriales bacterium]